MTSLLRTPIFHPNQNFEILVKSQLACGARATRGKGNEITEGAEFASRPAQILWRVKVIAMASNIVLELIADNYDALLRLGKMLGRDF